MFEDEYSKWLKQQRPDVRSWIEGAPLADHTPPREYNAPLEPATPDWASTNKRPLEYPSVVQESDGSLALGVWLWGAMLVLGVGIGLVIVALN